MEKSKKALPIVLASALAATPFVAVPQAYAVEKLDVSADNDGAGKESEYGIKFTLEEDLESGDTITVEFDSDFDVNKKISKKDISGIDVKKVEVDDNEVIITVDEDFDSGKKVSFTIKKGITNPDDKGTYEVSVKTENESSDEDKVDIKKSSSSSSSKNSKSKNDYSVTLSSKAAGEKVSLKLGKISLKSSDELETNSTITVTFPEKGMLPSSIDEDDVTVNGKKAKSVSVSGSSVDIKIPSGADGDDYMTLEFDKDAGIENPSSGDKYVIKVKYDGSTYESDEFEITKNGSSSSSASDSFTVNLSDPGAGARSSYTFDADFGNKELKEDGELILEFPSSDMVPGILTASDFLLNGKPAKKAAAIGNRIALVAPTGFKATSNVKVEVTYGAWVSNPKSTGSYTLKATVSGRTLESKSFSIGGSSVNPTPTNPTTPVPVPNTGTNNSTATIALTQNALGKQTGVNVAIKGLGVGLQKQRDFVEIVFPVGYKVPAYIAPANISVNGVGANFVAVRGQNVLIYPSQDIPAATVANIAINPAANIVNPAVKNTYSISVFTSEERGLLFARAVGVGMPSPAQPKPATPTPQQPSTAIPANSASFKVNTANFTLHGKTYPLSVAPYIEGNTTMVPAQFFKEALALTTQWNNSSVAVISGTKVVKFTVGSKTAKVGSTEIQLPTPVVLKNGMPMIPIRTVTDNLGYKVGWAAPSVYVYK
ncbi:copper amine oxidase N-terminal domain-containing protein [Brevibacillus antibioticus]|uniref:Copper amine oxidase N-terminal domain-containing protein n=1 Tax=Brevibacillus antibioticus TaxID=2570228 RepID=A0A4U2Y706_9BACL|nr:copper amine oxidase N-terminal domain-containing protein [Brevibacillus antibioticus]TKI55915.1 copper amine oxidase N-terminal domain-containing protein [Brevibacillus antibioticus]